MGTGHPVEMAPVAVPDCDLTRLPSGILKRIF